MPEHVPAVTINRFGNGQAIYLAIESSPSAIGPVLKYLCKLAAVQPGPQTPEGVYVRVVDGRTLYVNTTGEEKKIPITGTKEGIITHRVYQGTIILGAQEADLVP